MFVATVILSVLLAVAYLAAGVSKLTDAGQITTTLRHLGVSQTLQRVIGAIEVAAAAGLLIGLAIAGLGIAAAIGLAVLMTGALIYHRRARDRPADIAPVVVLLILAVLTAIVRAVSS